MEARLDKWLWAARIFKTRTIAADACKNNRVRINDAAAKPARTVKEGDIVSVRKPPVTYTFRVKQAIEKRVGAKLIPDVLENITDPQQYEMLEMSRISGFVDRARGTGRPTKKERRAIDDFMIPVAFDDSFMEDGDDDCHPFFREKKLTALILFVQRSDRDLQEYRRRSLRFGSDGRCDRGGHQWYRFVPFVAHYY